MPRAAIVDTGPLVAQVRGLWKKYADVPMSLADACLVRMSEKHDHHHVCKLDKDFTVYRKRGHEPIPLIIPPAAVSVK